MPQSFIDTIPVAERQRWRWTPCQSRWQPDLGLPHVPAIAELSTDMAPDSERWDFWRDRVFYEFEADPLERDAARSFTAHGTAALTRQSVLNHWWSGAMSGRRTRAQYEADGGDSLCIGIVIEGERMAEDAQGRRWRNGPGEAFVYDGARASRLAWTQHEGVHLVVRRPALNVFFGPDIPSELDLTERINRSPLFGMVREQLVAAARAMPQLAAPEQAFALDQAQRMVTFLLARSGGGASDAADGRAGLHAMAMRLIEQHLAAPDLSPDWIAARLNCSRTTLYRVFSERNDTVSAAIKRVRFDRARLELLATGPEIAVADIAARCGLYDATNFSTQFRRRFGYAPGELRRR